MTQRPESYLRYANDHVFDALEALEREALGRGVSTAASPLRGFSASPRSRRSSSARRASSTSSPCGRRSRSSSPPRSWII